MGKEGYPIHERTHTHNHAGKASETRGKMSAIAKIKDWFEGDTYLGSRKEPEVCYRGEPLSQHNIFPESPIPEDEEISLFFRDAKTQKDCE